MSCENFLKFYKDYEVFPSLLPIIKINEIFSALLEIMRKSVDHNGNNINGINDTLFNHSTVLIAHFLQTNSKTNKNDLSKLQSLLRCLHDCKGETEFKKLKINASKSVYKKIKPIEKNYY